MSPVVRSVPALQRAAISLWPARKGSNRWPGVKAPARKRRWSATKTALWLGQNPGRGAHHGRGPAFNVSDLIDTRPLGALQIRIVILCTLVALLDGLDLQSIGLAAPGIAADLHIPLPRLSAVFSAALAGLALGAFGFGVLADRVGP